MADQVNQDQTQPTEPQAAAPATPEAPAGGEPAAAAPSPAPTHRPHRGPGGGDRRGGPRRGRDRDSEDGEFADSVVKIYRCSRVVRGGRKFSYGALVVVGDRSGQVGLGYAKANEVPQAVEKSIKKAKKALQAVPLNGSTIPHPILARCGASKIRLIPASPGTGVIAGSAVRAVLELAGVRDVLTKASGSTNPKNLCKAVMEALKSLRSREQVSSLRGVAI